MTTEESPDDRELQELISALKALPPPQQKWALKGIRILIEAAPNLDDEPLPPYKGQTFPEGRK